MLRDANFLKCKVEEQKLWTGLAIETFLRDDNRSSSTYDMRRLRVENGLGLLLVLTQELNDTEQSGENLFREADKNK